MGTRNVRNFWADADIDGKRSNAVGGPRNKDGGMKITLYQRDNGTITTAINVDCFIDCEGKVVTVVKDKHGKEVYRNTTER